MTTQALKDLISKAAKGVTARGMPVSSQKPVKTAKPEPKGVTFIRDILEKNGVEYVTEFKFSETRRFRFDFYIPSLRLAAEYNGIFSDKSRHTTVTGYTKDREKINHAISLGYRVFEYTPLNYRDFDNDLKGIINA